VRKRVAVITAPLVTAVVVAMSLASPAAGAAPPAFGQLPVMGYNTWYQYGAGVTESEVLEQADDLVSSGLAAAGYDSVNLDDGWMASARTGAGSLTWNTTKFPDGIPNLARQIHALGLKFGIYEAIGTRTCQNLPGSGGTTASDNHYAQDAQTFAGWGVDFVKIDECGGLPSGTTLSSLTTAFEQYGAALKAANSSVVYSEELPIYVLGQSDFTTAVQSSATFANTWRVAADESPSDSASDTILGHLAADLHLHAFAGPGHWNDLDMLVPGTPAAHPFGWSLTDEESQLSVWAEEASPLLISTNLTTLTSLANLGTGSGTGTFTLSQLGISTARATGYNVWKDETTTFSGVSVTLAAGQTETLVIKPTGS
jgi:alpha-galactosidase